MNINLIRFSNFAENSFLSNAFSSSSMSKKIAMIAAAAFAAYLCFCTCRYFYYHWKKVEDGPGKVVSFFGDVVEGEFKDGLLNGQGKIERFFTVEEGEYKDGQLNGQGMICSRKQWPTAKARGEFKDGILNGQGTVTVDLGFLKIETTGEFKNGDDCKAQGPIKMIMSRKENVFYGPNIVERIIEGELENKWIKGKQTFSDGRVQEGTFKEGKLDGIGKTTFPDGRVEEGTYAYGQFVG